MLFLVETQKKKKKKVLSYTKILALVQMYEIYCALKNQLFLSKLNPNLLCRNYLLFILYINDIVNTTSLLELILFADDTTLLFSHPDIASQNDIINIELQEICNWFQANKLSANATKTNYMVLGTPQSTRRFIDVGQNIDNLNDSTLTSSSDVEKVKLNIKLDGVSLNRVSSTKFLGVIIDENLTWKNHIDAISKNYLKKYWSVDKA